MIWRHDSLCSESDNENEEMSDDEMELMKALDREIAEGEEQSESGSESPAVSADERGWFINWLRDEHITGNLNTNTVY